MHSKTREEWANITNSRRKGGLMNGLDPQLLQQLVQHNGSMHIDYIDETLKCV